MTVRLMGFVCLFAALSLFAQTPPDEQALPEVPVAEPSVQAAQESPIVQTEAGPRRVETQAAETSPFDIVGTATSQSMLRFMEDTTERARIEQIGTSNGSLPGTFRIFSTVSAPMLFGVGGTEKMRIHPDGNVSIGTTYNNGRLAVSGTSASGKALVVDQKTTISATPGSPQHDIGLYVHGVSNVASGVTTSGSVVGGYLHGYNSGPGTQPAAFGVRLFAGNLTQTPAVPGVVTAAYGAHVQVMKAGGTVTNGYAFYATNVEADNDYAFYQAGTDDDNYFAGNVGIGAAVPEHKLHVFGNENTTVRAMVQNASTGADAAGVVLAAVTAGSLASELLALAWRPVPVPRAA